MDSIRIDKDIRKVGEALKIAVISDTHGNLMRATSIIEGIRPFNLIVHLGDHASDLVKLSEIYDSRAVGLLGNEDMTAPVKAGADSGTKGGGEEIPFSDEIYLEAREIVIYAAHGHTFDLNPYYGEEKWRESLKALVARAKEGGAAAALFGHTHKPFLEIVDGVLTMNPGDVFPGAEWGHIGTMEVSKGEIEAEIFRFNEVSSFQSVSKLRYEM